MASPFINAHTHTLQTSTVECVNIYNWKNEDHIPEQVYFTVGLHPWFITQHNLAQQFNVINELAQQPSCLAIGECGLDKLCNTDWLLQCEAFELQINLAAQINKPLMLHAVRAADEVLQQLKDFKGYFIFHGFNNKATLAKKVLQQNGILSLGQALFNPKSNATQIICSIPIDQLLLETDDKAIAIEAVYEQAAQLLKIELVDLKWQLHENFKRIFAQQ